MPPADDIHSALRHPLRRQILAMVMKSERPVSQTDASDLLGLTLSNVSFHFRVLHEEQGLLVLAEYQPHRGSVKHFYVLAGNALTEHPWLRGTLEEIDVPLPLPTWPQPPIDEATFNRYRHLLSQAERTLVEYRRGWNGRGRKSREAIAAATNNKLAQVRLIERGAYAKIERARYEDEQGGS